MKKYLLLFLFPFLIGGLNAQQVFRGLPMGKAIKSDRIGKAATATMMEISYCGDITKSIGPGANKELKCAVSFPKTTMAKYVGNNLTKIMVGIGEDAGIKNGKIFLSHGLNEEPFHTQDVTFTKNSWNTVVLDTPYEIDGKALLIGYSLTSGTGTTSFPVAVDNGPMDPLGGYIALKDKQGLFQWYFMTDVGFNKNACIKGIVEGNSLPQIDLSLREVKMSNYFLKLSDKLNIDISLRNIGAQPINSFDLVYQLGNADAVTISKTGLDLACGGSYSIELEDLAVGVEGLIPVKVSIVNPNGVADEDESNNVMTEKVLCTNLSVPRKVLLEHFTTMSCPNCPEAHTILEKVLGDNENVIWVAHHSGYKADVYTIPESEDYMCFYNSSVYAPAIMFDRANLAHLGALCLEGPATGPVFQVSNEALVEKTLNSRFETPAYVTVDVKETFNADNNQLDITVSGNSVVGGLLGNNVRMNLFLTENNNINYQASGGSKYVHNHVLRKVLSDVWGDPVTFDGEGNYTVSYSCTLDQSWKPQDMNVIAFLNRYDSENVNNREVYNAGSFSLKSDPNSISSTNGTEVAYAYSDGSLIVVDGEFTTATIYNTTGKLIGILDNSQNNQGVENGIYIVKVVQGEQTIVCKVVVNG